MRLIVMDDLNDHIKNLNGPEPSPYFASRVLAHRKYEDEKKKVFIWKFVSGFCLTLGLLCSLYFFQETRIYKFDYQKAPVHKSMMLVLKDVPQDARITYVSLEIDEGMVFDLTNPNLRDKKEITLAINSESLRLGRLPFVFLAEVAGKRNIKIKYLDADFEILQVETHYLEFLDVNNSNNKQRENVNEKVHNSYFSSKFLAS